MNRYPLLFEIKNKKLLFVGGGQVSERKIKSLLICNPIITVLSPEVTDGIKNLVTLGAVVWTQELPEDEFDYLFIATDSHEVNSEVYNHYKGRTLINIADDPDACDFHMPAVTVKDDVIISVSTDGKSPSKAKKIREKLDKWIEEGGLD